MIKNQLADMLARIQNASHRRHNSLTVIFTKLNCAILKTLFCENFIDGYSVYFDNAKKKIKIFLKYFGWWLKKPAIISLKIASKVHRPEFLNLKKVVNKLSFNNLTQKILLISTSNGIMTLKKASSLNLGGKVLCYIN